MTDTLIMDEREALITALAILESLSEKALHQALNLCDLSDEAYLSLIRTLDQMQGEYEETDMNAAVNQVGGIKQHEDHTQR